MAAVDPFLADITRVALSASARHGFALGGGNALVLHGVVDRPTVDVDLFTDHDDSVRTAAEHVRAALTADGMVVTEVLRDSALDGVIDGLADLMIELDVLRDDRVVRMSLSGLFRTRQPVIMELGPVMHLDDLIAWKVAAIVNRREPRDYVDVAAFLAVHTPDDLIARARRVDPGLEGDDVLLVGRYLDRIPDAAFAVYGLSAAAVTELKVRFEAWPRRPGS
jgi:hypothetical protein